MGRQNHSVNLFLIKISGGLACMCSPVWGSSDKVHNVKVMVRLLKRRDTLQCSFRIGCISLDILSIQNPILNSVFFEISLPSPFLQHLSFYSWGALRHVIWGSRERKVRKMVSDCDNLEDSEVYHPQFTEGPTGMSWGEGGNSKL